MAASNGGSRLRWPHRRLTLWHPESPGVRVTVDVLWPRYLLRPEFATIGEVLRMYGRRCPVSGASNRGHSGGSVPPYRCMDCGTGLPDKRYCPCCLSGYVVKEKP